MKDPNFVDTTMPLSALALILQPILRKYVSYSTLSLITFASESTKSFDATWTKKCCPEFLMQISSNYSFYNSLYTSKVSNTTLGFWCKSLFFKVEIAFLAGTCLDLIASEISKYMCERSEPITLFSDVAFSREL